MAINADAMRVVLDRVRAELLILQALADELEACLHSQESEGVYKYKIKDGSAGKRSRRPRKHGKNFDECLSLGDRSLETMERLNVESFAHIGNMAADLDVSHAVALHEQSDDKFTRRALRVVICCNAMTIEDGFFDKTKLLRQFKQFRIEVEVACRDRTGFESESKLQDIVSIFSKAGSDRIAYLNRLHSSSSTSTSCIGGVIAERASQW